YFSQLPLCDRLQPTTTGLQDDAVTKHYASYRTPSSPDVRFRRPRGVAIQPFLWFESPRFGDRVGPGQGIELVWRDPRAVFVRIALLDPAVPDANGQP